MKSFNLALTSALALLPLAFGRPNHDVLPGVLRRRRAQANPPKQAKANICDMQNPFSMQETGCPCFTQEIVANQMTQANLEASDWCEIMTWTNSEAMAYAYEEIYFTSGLYTDQENSSVSFSTFRNTEPGYEGMSCSAYIDAGSSTTDDVGNAAGENVGFYISAEVTEEEYNDCKIILNSFKDNLPAKCTVDDAVQDW